MDLGSKVRILSCFGKNVTSELHEMNIQCTKVAVVESTAYTVSFTHNSSHICFSGGYPNSINLAMLVAVFCKETLFQDIPSHSTLSTKVDGFTLTQSAHCPSFNDCIHIQCM